MGKGTGNGSGSVNTQFQPGHKMSVGKRGPDQVTNLMKTLIMGAADDLGEDGQGKDGARGWLRLQARTIPADYLKLIGKIFPAYVALELKAQFNTIIRHSTEREDYESLEEIHKALEADGITIDHLLPPLDVSKKK